MLASHSINAANGATDIEVDEVGMDFADLSVHIKDAEPSFNGTATVYLTVAQAARLADLLRVAVDAFNEKAAS